MSALDALHLSAGLQAFQPVLADGLQHSEARLFSLLLCLLQEAFIHQRGDHVQHVRLVLAAKTGGFRRLQGTAANEDRESLKEPLLPII